MSSGIRPIWRRMALWLCLLTVLFNTTLPSLSLASGALSHSPSDYICSASTPTENHQTEADHVRHSKALLAHCSLCPVMAGLVLAPPPPSVFVLAPLAFRAIDPATDDQSRPSLSPTRLRPSPRAPPTFA